MSRELGLRVVTGVLGASLLIALVTVGGVGGTVFLTLVLSFGMLYEFSHITFNMPDKQQKFWVLAALALLAFVMGWMSPTLRMNSLFFTFLALFTYFLVTAQRYQGSAFLAHCQELMYSIFAIVYLIYLPLLLPAIRQDRFGQSWVLLFLFVNWAGDTGAYFVGKRFGKHKLYPLISPKKTVEGAFGGLLASMLVALICTRVFHFPIPAFLVVAIAAIVSVVSQVGDLCESFLKRAFDKKDSGKILPGHGGFLDRFDGVVFSLPAMYTLIQLLR
ncbi:MAG: phosphatidate cytidylyltransferase [Bacteriovoracia bacterium]